MTVNLPMLFSKNFAVTKGSIGFSVVSGMSRSDIIGSRNAHSQAALKLIYSIIKQFSKKIPYGRKLLSYETKHNVINQTKHCSLAIFMAVLLASKQIKALDSNVLFLGGLSLDGKLMPTDNLALLIKDIEVGEYDYIVLPSKNSYLAKYFPELPLVFFSDVGGVLDWCNDGCTEEHELSTLPPAFTCLSTKTIDQVKGQGVSKRALMIAAAGKHHILLAGSAGSGKTMLLKMLPGLNINTSPNHDLLRHMWHSYWGNDSLTNQGIITNKHTISEIRGTKNNPLGELHKSYFGYLTIPELGDLPSGILKYLKTIFDRVSYVQETPNSLKQSLPITVAASTNLCPCGFWGTNQECVCAAYIRQRYQGKLTGPLVQRFTIQTLLENDQNKQDNGLTDAVIRKTINQVYQRQLSRNRSIGILYNEDLQFADFKEMKIVDGKAWRILERASQKHMLALRTVTNILKVALTITDIANRRLIDEDSILEALQYQQLGNKLGLSGFSI